MFVIKIMCIFFFFCNCIMSLSLSFYPRIRDNYSGVWSNLTFDIKSGFNYKSVNTYAAVGCGIDRGSLAGYVNIPVLPLKTGGVNTVRTLSCISVGDAVGKGTGTLETLFRTTLLDATKDYTVGGSVKEGIVFYGDRNVQISEEDSSYIGLDLRNLNIVDSAAYVFNVSSSGFVDSIRGVKTVNGVVKVGGLVNQAMVSSVSKQPVDTVAYKYKAVNPYL